MTFNAIDEDATGEMKAWLNELGELLELAVPLSLSHRAQSAGQ